MIRKFSLGILATTLIVLAFWGHHMRQDVKRTSLSTKLDQIVGVTNEPSLDCAHIATQNPLVILALGQSNAANHGERTYTPGVPVVLFTNGKCIIATDPLPGSTGSGGSIWSHLPRYLKTPDPKRPLVLSVMGIDATTVSEWTDNRSPLARRLTAHVKSMKANNLLPQVVLWQQGEADARLGTSAQAYGAGLNKLSGILTQAGSEAPIIAAFSTVCRSAPNATIRSAVKAMAQTNDRFKVGPDTDALTNIIMRFDGCHFSTAGLDRAAQLWAGDLNILFVSI